jgi:hypothetical protein
MSIYNTFQHVFDVRDNQWSYYDRTCW